MLPHIYWQVINSNYIQVVAVAIKKTTFAVAFALIGLVLISGCVSGSSGQESQNTPKANVSLIGERVALGTLGEFRILNVTIPERVCEKQEVGSDFLWCSWIAEPNKTYDVSQILSDGRFIIIQRGANYTDVLHWQELGEYAGFEYGLNCEYSKINQTLCSDGFRTVTCIIYDYYGGYGHGSGLSCDW